jgi:hypothetical protein
MFFDRRYTWEAKDDNFQSLFQGTQHTSVVIMPVKFCVLFTMTAPGWPPSYTNPVGYDSL